MLTVFGLIGVALVSNVALESAPHALQFAAHPRTSGDSIIEYSDTTPEGRLPPTPPTPPTPKSPKTPKAPQPPRPPRPATAWGDRMTKIDTTLAFASNGRIDLDLTLGSVRVVAWDKNMIRVQASMTPNVDGFDFDISRSSLELHASPGPATVVVNVPPGTSVSISTVQASVSVNGIGAPIDVNTVSGHADVTNARRVTMETVSGNAKVEGARGEVSVSTVSGQATGNNFEGNSANIETISGPIVVNRVRVKRLSTSTVSGTTTFDGALEQDGRLSFESNSGAVRLKLPSGTKGLLAVETTSGAVHNDYPGAKRRQEDPDESHTRFRYVLGSPEGGRIAVETYSGGVWVGTP